VADVVCELCEASRMTTWYHEDDDCWIADCEICEVPMVVWRTHAVAPPPDVLARLLAALRTVADARFGADEYAIDDHMRNIPDHYHAHARDHGFWSRFGARRR
jgi:hypothetical protein